MSKKNAVLRSQGRKVVHNVHLFMTKMHERGPNHFPEDIVERTAIATGVPQKDVRRVILELSDPDNKTNKSSKNKEPSLKYIPHSLKIIVRDCIYDYFYITERVVPTVKQVYKKLKEDHQFPGNIRTLKRCLRDLGFTKLRINKSLSVLIEKNKFVLQRIKYCEAIARYQSEGRTIVYAGFSAIGSVPMNTSGESERNYKFRPQKIILGQALSSEGYVPNAQFLFQETTRKVYNNTYHRWMRTQVVPNLPPNSVVVIDNVSCNNILEDYVITINSNRSDMKAWLSARNIPFSDDMFKPNLYKLISSHPDHHIQYKINTIIEQAGHQVLRIPEVYLDLNPMSMIFDDICKFVTENKDSITNYTDFKALITEKYGKISSIESKILINKVNKVEEKYRKLDRLIDDLTDVLAEQVEEEESRGKYADIMLTDQDDSDSSMDSIKEEEIYIKEEPIDEDPLSI